MFRYISVLFITLFCATATAAKSPDPEAQAAKDALWDAIVETDYAEVQAIIANAHIHYLTTGEHPDRTRVLFELFYANNPLLDRFAEGWLEAYPNSPYAHTAQAWLYHKVSWDIRGTGLAREIYPQALAEFGEMQRAAWDHAYHAYEADSRLLPATDAILRLATANGEQRFAYDVLAQVMQSNPNMGTLLRAIDLTIPGWGPGGTWDKAVEICEHYGPMIPDYESDPATYCKLYSAIYIHRAPERRAWVLDAVTTGDYPEFEHTPAYFYTTETANRVEAEFVRAYLNRADVIDVKNARDFDLHVAERYGFDYMRETHERRAWNEARVAIERDPYNPELLDTLLSGVVGRRDRDGNTFTMEVEGPTWEERREYRRRLLVASPYDPKRWIDYAITVYPTNRENILLDDPARINAIVYSDHDPGYIYDYAREKWQLLASLERLEHEPQMEAFQKLDEKRKAKARADIQKWLAVRANLDLDEDFRCPMMRAYRLFQALCETSNSHRCEMDPQMHDMFEIVRADVNERRVCTGAMSATMRELFFTPVPVDLSPPEG